MNKNLSSIFLLVCGIIVVGLSPIAFAFSIFLSFQESWLFLFNVIISLFLFYTGILIIKQATENSEVKTCEVCEE